MFRSEILGDGDFPFVPIAQQLFLVVEKLLVRLGSKFVIRTFYDSVYRACFLAKTAINAFGHIDIVAGRFPAPIFPLICFNSNGLRRANSFAQFAGNATFFATRVSTQSVFTAKSRAKWTLLKWLQLFMWQESGFRA